MKKESILNEVKQAIKREFKEYLWWFIVGAVIGGILLGGFGLYFFALKGLGIGLVVGAILGGIGLLLFYIMNSSLFWNRVIPIYVKVNW